MAVYEQIGPYFEVCSLLVTRYTYDGSGRLTSMTLPSGRTLEYGYESGALYPASVEVSTSTDALLFGGDLLESATYLPGGELASYSLGAVSFSESRDYAGQAMSRTYATPVSTGFSWEIGVRDGVGNIEQVGDTVTGRDLALTYDGQYQVASSVGTGLRGYQSCTEFLYDGAGNRTSETCEGTTISYGYETGASGDATNRLASISWDAGGTCARAVTRDDNGRAETGYARKLPLSSDRLTMAYGADGRLSSVSAEGGGLLASYAYDHRNLRLLKTTATASNYYTYDTHGRLISERGPDGVKEYVYLNGTLVAVMTSSGTSASEEPMVYAVGVDHLGTPMRAWDRTTGVAAWAADYEAFGRAYEYLPDTTAAPGVSIALRFPGQYEDEETGLHYNWHRYYDPDTGRYLTPDPLTFSPVAPLVSMVSANLGRPLDAYAYALGNPVRFTDPTGEIPTVADVLTCLANPFDCAAASSTADDAAQQTADKLGIEPSGIGDGSKANGIVHCTWQCLLTKEIGADEARKFGNSHESFGSNDKAHCDMDLKNNDLGRMLGDHDVPSCVDACTDNPMLKYGVSNTGTGVGYAVSN
jgi:RHS repeat-associated protein